MDRKERAKSLHEQALKIAQRFFSAEVELLEILQQIDADRAYLDLNYTSLFTYAVGALKLSESTALNFINVARKAVQVPALKTEIASGQLGVSKARKIVPVLTAENQAAWIDKAKTLSSRDLEKEVARVIPQAAKPERARPVSESRVGMSLTLDKKIFEAIKRVQDLESQRLRRAVSLEETLAAMSAIYLERNDPVEKAKRLASKKADASRSGVPGQARQELVGAPSLPVTGQVRREIAGRRPLPAALKHQVNLRDQGQCTYTNDQGLRCQQRRWIETHHIVPLNMGGTDHLENLTTLCSGHHKMEHA